MEDVIVNGMPESLRRFIVEDCSIPAASFKILPGAELPEPAKQLMFHDEDMTSTLARFYDSQICVDKIQSIERGDVYLREVFLRTKRTHKVVEYGVIAIVLDSFDQEQQGVIKADKEPFGGLLHQFKIDFKSAPVCFFNISAEHLMDPTFEELTGSSFFGRFNRLSKTNGQTLAWIMEILPGE